MITNKRNFQERRFEYDVDIIYPEDVSGYDMAEKIAKTGFLSIDRNRKSRTSREIRIPGTFQGTYRGKNFELLLDPESLEIKSNDETTGDELRTLFSAFIKELQIR